MDLHMDVMDGFEAAGRIRATNATVPIFAVSADVVGDIAERCESVGFTRIVPKPYDPAMLLREIDRVLHSNETEGYGKKRTLEKVQPSLDVKKGLKQVDGDVDLYRKIIDLYRDEMKIDLAKLEKGVADANWNLVAQMSHKFKGGALTIGAGRLGELSKTLQRMAQDGAPGIEDDFDAFKDELLRLYGEMDRYLANSATKSQ